MFMQKHQDADRVEKRLRKLHKEGGRKSGTWGVIETSSGKKGKKDIPDKEH